MKKNIKVLNLIILLILAMCFHSVYAAEDVASFNAGLITVKGKTDSMKAGKLITMVILKKDKTSEDFFALTDYSEIETVVANIQVKATTSGGRYSFTAAIDDTYESAIYNIIIDGEGMETLKNLSVECINLSEFTSAIAAIDAITDSDVEATNTIIANKDLLGLDTYDYEKNLSSNHQSKVNKFLISKGYSNLDITQALIKIREDFNLGVGLQLINKADSVTDMEYAIEQYNQYFKLDLGVYKKYDNKSELFERLYPVDFKDIATLQEVFYEESVINFIKTSNLAGAVKEVLEAHSSDIGIDISNNSDYKKADSSELYKEFMKNRGFNDYPGIESAMNNAIAEINKPKKEASGGGGGGLTNNKGKESITVEKPIDTKPNLTPSGFKDIEYHWAKENIDYMYSKGYIKGIDEESYAPDTSISRAQFVTIMVRVLDLTQEQDNVFTDVSAEQWYKSDVNKAAKAGLISGQPGEFRPDDFITRQELMKIAVNAYKYKNKSYTVQQQELLFADKDSVANWATEYISSAVELELVKGINEDGKTYINPTGNTTRAEAATILKRLVDKIN